MNRSFRFGDKEYIFLPCRDYFEHYQPRLFRWKYTDIGNVQVPVTKGSKEYIQVSEAYLSGDVVYL